MQYESNTPIIMAIIKKIKNILYDAFNRMIIPNYENTIIGHSIKNKLFKIANAFPNKLNNFLYFHQ